METELAGPGTEGGGNPSGAHHRRRRRAAAGFLGALISLVALVELAQARVQAAFDCSGSCMVTVGTTVTFTSTSTSTSPIRNYEWDLDGDRLYGAADDPDDPYGPNAQTAQRSFPAAGSFEVGLRVTNGAAEQGTATRTVMVSSTPPPPPPPPPPPGPPPPPLSSVLPVHVCKSANLPGLHPTYLGTKYHRILGTNQGETLTGGRGADLIIGGRGGDHIAGLAGPDIVCAGEGNDTVYGGLGNDVVDGDATPGSPFGCNNCRVEHFNDKIFGGEDQDYLVGEKGDDRAAGGNGNDDVFGADGHDELFGDIQFELNASNTNACADFAGPCGLGAGNDIIDGGPGDDELYAGGGDNKLRGQAGYDFLFGSSEDDASINFFDRTTYLSDRLFGGPDFDYLNGKPGPDYLYGANGLDFCIADPVYYEFSDAYEGDDC